MTITVTSPMLEAHDEQKDVRMAGECRDVQGGETLPGRQPGVCPEPDEHLRQLEVALKAGLLQRRPAFLVVLVEVHVLRMLGQEVLDVGHVGGEPDQVLELPLQLRVEARLVRLVDGQDRRLGGDRQRRDGAQRLQHLVVLGREPGLFAAAQVGHLHVAVAA